MIELHEAAIVAPTHDGEVQVLAPTTLTLAEHRIALIGANGSGKSSLARLLNGLVLPTSGSVRVRAETRSTLPAAGSTSPPEHRWLDTARDGAAVRRQVGFVFTNPATQLVMPTVIEDVALSLRRQHPRKADRLAAAHAALARFGLEHLADRSVHTLSGGQQQLLAIASVLAVEPAILIVDEPTTLLDLRNSRRISELLLGLPQQLIVATHDLELAARCDRVLVIADGRVVRDSASAAHAPAASPGAVVAWYREHA